MIGTKNISSSFHNNLISNLSGVFYKCLNDDDRTILFISQKCETLTGYKDEELLNNKIISFGSLIYLEDIFKLREKIECDKINYHIEYRIIDRNGIIKLVKDIANGIYDDKGNLLYIEGYLEDLTPFTSSNNIVNSYSIFQNAINTTTSISTTDKNGRIIYANENFIRYSKYNLKELIGQDHRILNSGHHPSSFFTNLWETIGKKNQWRGEICNKAKDGSLYWVDTIIKAILNEDQQIEQYLSISNIITDKKKVEYALQKSEDQLRKVFDRVNDVIYTISKDGKFLSLNHAFEKISGWEIKKWIGRSFLNLLHPEDVNIAITMFRRVFKGEHVDSFELRIKTKMGKYIYTELTPSVLIEKDIIVSSLGTARDITFRKETELKMKLIYDTISVKTGMNYFSNLAKYCCDNLNVKYAYIGVYLPNEESIQTLSFRRKNQSLENFSYKIKNTPAHKVINMEGFAFLENVQTKFPKSEDLKTLGIESFMGYPLFSEDYEVLGIIALMDDKPITDALEKENILSYVLSRTANEIKRNAVEKKLKESEEFNKGVLSSLTSHIAVLNKNGDILSVNDAWTNFYTKNGETILSRAGIGTNYFEACEKASITDDTITKKALNGIKSVLNNKTNSFQIEYPFLSKENEYWFMLSVSIYESSDTKVVVRHIDITERRKIENQLKKSEKNYRDLIENSQDIVFSVDKTAKFIFTNKYSQTILKYSSEELNELELLDIIHQDHQKDCLKSLQDLLNGKKSISIESVFVTKKRKNIFVEGNMTPIIIDGEIIGIQSFFRDISERKKAESELIKSEHRYKNVVENINDAIIIRNLKGQITYANQRFHDLLGFEKDDLVGLSMEDYIAPGWQAEIRKQYSKFINNIEIPEVYEYQGLHNDGTTRWLEDKITLLYENNKIIGTQAVIRDITEMKRKENDLKKLINELTNRNNEMMQFNYIVSHNLRAPIANIIGLSNLVNSENINQTDGKLILEHIKDSSLKMDEMIKDLSIVLNTRSNLNAKKEKTFFHYTIQSISKILEEQIAISKCRLTVNIDPLANEMFTIKSYIESILFNLISNAIKYRSVERPLLINIDIRKGNGKTLITISDNGIGINLAENGNYIFGLYKRFNYDVEGKGLGLHMTKAQVEALGGNIKIESEVNMGTTFKIEFST